MRLRRDQQNTASFLRLPSAAHSISSYILKVHLCRNIKKKIQETVLTEEMKVMANPQTLKMERKVTKAQVKGWRWEDEGIHINRRRLGLLASTAQQFGSKLPHCLAAASRFLVSWWTLSTWELRPNSLNGQVTIYRKNFDVSGSSITFALYAKYVIFSNRS